MTTLPKSPVAIREIGNIIVQTAYEQVAKEMNVPVNNISNLMIDDEQVYKRVKEYIESASNYALGKIVKF